MQSSNSGYTVKLETTSAHKGELWGDSDLGCQFCDSQEFLLVEINGYAGSRKRVQSCYECGESFRESPNGVHDPTVLGYTEGADYNGY